MYHHEIPQKRERQQKLELLALSPNPLIYLPLWQQALKRDLILLRWRGGIQRRVEIAFEGSTEKLEASSSSESSHKPDHSGEAEAL
jgi:hypothetical protein